MDSRSFEAKLSGHKLFKDLRECLNQKPCDKLRNLLELKDEVLYVWNPLESCLMCLNLKYFEEHGDETPYQKLHMLSPPAFTVERVMASACGSRVCVWGSRGVTVAELPARWGRGGLFDSGNQSILCKSCSVDERLLYCQGDVRRVHWHPSSLSHVLVLVSDNTIRLYNIALKSGPKLVKSLSIGPKPTAHLAGRTILDSLGDTAVDFTPVPDQDTLLILRGNGDVYMLPCGLDELSGGLNKVRGPLVMYPPADDNYGSESCSITCVGGTPYPPLVVVATCSAALYHCLLLPNAGDDECDSHALYVIEAVELNVPDEQTQHSYPVQLYPCSSNTYACVHAGGVHTVSLPMLAHLADLAAADDSEAECVVSALVSSRSCARHAVHTRAAAPLLGLTLTHPPLTTLMLLTSNGELMHRTLDPYNLEEQLYKEMQLHNPALERDDVDAILKERQKLSFSAIIQEILRRDVSQPILSIANKQELTPKQYLEIVTEATVKLRGEYMSRQQRAADATRDKVAALRQLATQHRAWMELLQSEIEEVHQQSAALREKCLIAEKHQEDLKYRCSNITRMLRRSTSLSSGERELLCELTRARRDADAQREQLHALKQHTKNRREQMLKWNEEYKRKDLALGKSHSDTIASILQQQTSQISSLIEETKLLKDQLSIV